MIDPIATDYVVVREFGDLRLMCIATGHPKPTIRWSIGGDLSRQVTTLLYSF